jgi:hypothetical protein
MINGRVSAGFVAPSGVENLPVPVRRVQVFADLGIAYSMGGKTGNTIDCAPRCSSHPPV